MSGPNYTPDPAMVARLALETPYSHVWWEHQLHLVLATEVIPEEDLEAFARWCVSYEGGKTAIAPAAAAETIRYLTNYHSAG